MLRFLADENFHGDVTQGLLLRRPGLNLIRVQDMGLLGADDPQILAWAADHGCIVLTRDRATMPDFAFKRIAAGAPMPGLFVIRPGVPGGELIEELLALDELSQPGDWDGQVVHIPL